jgi:glyoxylase-like metal-dependent hydrolase (beta-lactamase superfamily II)
MADRQTKSQSVTSPGPNPASRTSPHGIPFRQLRVRQAGRCDRQPAPGTPEHRYRPLHAGRKETDYIPWDGPRVRIIEHQAHAPGHAALLIENERVLIAGDMVSDVLIPLLDLRGAENPVHDYLDALRRFEDIASEADIFIPGHGSVGSGDELRRRIDQDRAYVIAVRDGHDPVDTRVGPVATFGRDWLPGVHARQVRTLSEPGN